MAISLVITGYLLFFSVMLKKSKLLYFLDFSWMWIQLAYCTDYNRVDYPNYARRFNVIFQEDIQSTEYGYVLINKLLYKLGVDFNTAYAIMMLFVIIALAIWVYNKSEYYSEVAALFLIYPLYISGIQIRSFIAGIIILYGLDFLQKGDKKSLLLYDGFCIMATLIQSSSIIYMLLVPVRMLSRKKTIIYTLSLTFISFFIIKYFYSIFSILFGAKRFEEKIMVKNTLLEVGMIGVWQLTLLLIILFLIKIIKTENVDYHINDTDNFTINVLIFLSFLIPMYSMDFSLERILRSLLPLYYCFFLNMSSKIYSKNRIYIKGLFYGWFIITTFIFNVYLSNRWDIVIIPFLNNSDLINNPQKHIILIFIIVISAINLMCIDYNNISIAKANNIE